MIDHENYLKPLIQRQKCPQTSVKVLKKVTNLWKNIHLKKFQPYVHGCAKEICLLALFVVKQNIEQKVLVCFGKINSCAIIQAVWNEMISDSLISTLQTWGLFGQIWVTKPYVTITDFQPPLKSYQNFILHETCCLELKTSFSWSKTCFQEGKTGRVFCRR